MDFEKIAKIIKGRIEKSPKDPSLYWDLFSLAVEWAKVDRVAGHYLNREVRAMSAAAVGKVEALDAKKMFETYKQALRFDALIDFDAFMRYIELGQSPEKRFYAPRAHYLKPVVEGYQDVLDGKLDLLTVSMPKRAGKSQTEILFTLMISGQYPDRSTLMEGTGDDLVNSFYKGCLEYLDKDSEYLFYDIFPKAKIVNTNADIKTFNLRTNTRFPTVMCRSIDARQVGLSEATNVLILDDCVEGREEAKNRQRLDDKWEVIRGDVMGRALEGTPIVATGTRYSIYDPIGRLQDVAQEQRWKWRAIEVPALDPVTDESNYEYLNPKLNRKVFTTKFFREQRDMLSAEQFESEFQQQPFEAKGLLFNKDDLNYFYEVPQDRDPDTIICVADTAERGSDSTAMPVAAIYGTEVYIVDLVFDNSPPEVTKPECASCIIRNKVADSTWESNNAGEYYARDVEKICRDRGYIAGFKTKRTISNKVTRIEMASDTIKKSFFFKHPSTYARNSQYAAFMKEVTTYTRTGKVPHDDAPDSLSLMENVIRGLAGSKVEVMPRPF